MLEDRFAQHDKIPGDTYAAPVATYSMRTWDYVVRPTVAAAAIIITLPPVTEAKGRFYSITAMGNVTGALPVTIQDNDESAGWADLVLFRLRQSALLYSDGISWHNLSGGAIATIRTTILSAAVKTLAATQVTLVPAPGAGRVIEFLSATLKLEYGGTNVFTEAADNLVIKYTDDSGVAVSTVVETTGFIDQAVHTLTRAIPVLDAIVAYTAAANQPLVLDNNNAEIAGNAGGDNILYVDTTFRIISY